MVGGHSALPAPVAWWCQCSVCLQSAVGHSTFLDLGSGMSCPKKLFQRWHFQVSGADLNPSSYISHILMLSSNCTFDTSGDVYHLGHSKNHWTELCGGSRLSYASVAEEALMINCYWYAFQIQIRCISLCVYSVCVCYWRLWGFRIRCPDNHPPDIY